MTLESLNPKCYTEQLSQKVQDVRRQFASFLPPEIKVVPSEPKHYRQRAEFRVWHEGEDLYYIMFDPKTKKKYRVDQFPPASALINEYMPEVLKHIKHHPTLRYKLFQIDFLSTLSGEILISMLYHKPIDDTWEQEARALKERLSHSSPVHIIGRSRKKKCVIDQDFVIEKFPLKHATLEYKQVENSFTQPNGKVAIEMLEWAIEATQSAQGDLLELYCGNGNFSIALAQNFRKVLATEISKSSVDAAQYNLKVNHINNVKIIRLSAEEFTQALHKERAFNRLEGIDLDSYQCNTVLVDPPRAGLDDATVKMIQAYDHILYISCNPDTLESNLETLCTTHEIQQMAVFDQFPYTHHVELGVLLVRKP